MSKGGTGLRRRTWAWIILGGVLLAVLPYIQVSMPGPRVHVRWHEGVSPADRTAAATRYDLRNGTLLEGTTWRYNLGESSRENIRALLQDPAVDDTSYINRDSLTTEDDGISVTLSYPFRDLFDQPSDLLSLHRSLWLVLCGGLLVWAAGALTMIGRRRITIATLLFVAVMAVQFPFAPSFVTMGASADHVRNREDFERWFGGRVRYEKHLSQVILLHLYQWLDDMDDAPERAVIAMTRGATAWFVLSALAIAFLEGWSTIVLRYLGLALLAPSALLYFGWREPGYLSLTVAAFPLIARGLRDGGMRLEAGSAWAGLGAALHGVGLVSLVGAGVAALATLGRLKDRIVLALRITAWATAAYLGWIALYLIVLNLPVVPDPVPGEVSPWRPWLVDEIREGRVSPAILSATGARDLLMTAWVVGAPVLLVVLSLWRRYPQQVRTAVWYSIPSLFFVIFRWPFEGIGGGMDLVVAGFPALYALIWVCAHDSRRTNIAAALLISAHYAFWRMVLDQRFEP